MNYVNVQLSDFHNTTIKAFVTPNEDGSSTIFLNSRFDSETLKKAYLHELRHLDNCDFENDDVQSIETKVRL